MPEPHIFKHLDITKFLPLDTTTAYHPYQEPWTGQLEFEFAHDLPMYQPCQEPWADMIEHELGPKPKSATEYLSPAKTLEACLRSLNIFCTQDDTCILDLRIEPPEHYACQDRGSLIRALALDLEHYENVMEGRDQLARYYPKRLQGMMGKLERFRDVYIRMHNRLRLFKGRHPKPPKPSEVEKAVDVLQRATGAVGAEEYRQWIRSNDYQLMRRDQLVEGMYLAFKAHGPINSFPSDAIYEAISHLLKTFCITPPRMTRRAISKRAFSHQSVEKFYPHRY